MTFSDAGSSRIRGCRFYWRRDVIHIGGRGSSSGVSDKGRAYGTEFKTLFQSGNIKFITATSHDSELFETQTKGRVYVTVTKEGNPKSIYYFDKDLKKVKNIDLTHTHNGKKPHVHHGYEHSEKDKHGGTGLLTKEKKMVDRVRKLWDDHKRK